MAAVEYATLLCGIAFPIEKYAEVLGKCLGGMYSSIAEAVATKSGNGRQISKEIGSPVAWMQRSGMFGGAGR